MNEIHKPVMLEEVLHYLNLKEDGIYVDSTLGTGGHSWAILERLNRGQLIACEWDEKTAKFIQQDSKFSANSRFILINDNFANLANHLEKLNISKVDGFLFDLGLSSYQLAGEKRGFSYRLNSPLDMRINQNKKLTAAEVINNYNYEKLTDIFYHYGEENKARIIARKICAYRQKEKITSTQRLVKIVASCFPRKKNRHPARKVFQALRIFINNELTNLIQGLETAIKYLAVGGRIIVISYHSLEDRVVKQIFRKYSEFETFQLINKKPIRPTTEEIINNHRARSAKMRIITRWK
jgi:16S rRNA (cytosine1402-N4)-methyltransferase